MKKTSRLIAIMIIPFTLLQAQSMEPISTHAEWRYRYFRIISQNHCYFDDGLEMTNGTDTLINNKLYFIVYYRGRISRTGCNVPLTSFVSPVADKPESLIRFEGKKVYCVRNINFPDSEFLLYDFGLSVGDTVPYFIPSSVVTDIDAVNIASKWYKRFITSGTAPIIEGFGTDYSGILPPGQTSGANDPKRLLCFKEAESPVFYPDSQCDSYISPILTTSTGVPQHFVSVSPYPNPSSGEILIRLGKSTFTNIRIFNGWGQQVHVKNSQFENDMMLSPEIFPSPGIYTILLSNTAHNNFARLSICRI